jgi:hypothetical protein
MHSDFTQDFGASDSTEQYIKPQFLSHNKHAVCLFNLLKPTGHVMHHQFNIQ